MQIAREASDIYPLYIREAAHDIDLLTNYVIIFSRNSLADKGERINVRLHMTEAQCCNVRDGESCVIPTG